MKTAPTLDLIKTYYDERIEGKLRDFTNFNPRIEAAVQTMAEWAPSNPKRVLEIGCGIGATAWRMARAWPEAEIIGADVSPLSIQVARACFRRSNLHFHEGLISEGTLTGKFDLLVLMDVYEHVALRDRPSIHSALKSLVAEEARIFLSFPTPALQLFARCSQPSGIQPVDEDVTLADAITLAEETGTQILYYREVGIWRYGDYAHLVLGRYKLLTDVALRAVKGGRLAEVKQRFKRLLKKYDTHSSGRLDYLGTDLLRDHPRITNNRFKVMAGQRRRLASMWFPQGSKLTN